MQLPLRTVVLLLVIAFFAGRGCDVAPGPGPGPEPVPPGPTPDVVTTGPIFGVVVYDTENPGSILRSERDALAGKAIDEYLSARALKVGRDRQWRVWDDDKIGDEHIVEESQQLRDAYAKAKSGAAAIRAAGRNPYPYVVLSNGKSGFAGEWPDQEADALALLRKYGG